jgi:hypothetical protein
MRMGFQDRSDRDAGFLRRCQNGLGEGHARLAAAMVEVEHWIDHRAFHARRIPHQIAHGIGRFVEKCPDFGLLSACCCSSHVTLPEYFVVRT